MLRRPDRTLTVITRRAVTTALAALLLAAVPGLPARAQPEGMRIFFTEYGYTELVDRLEQAIKDHDMYLVTRASASAGAKNRGIEIPGNTVIGVFRNDFALRMLEASVPAGIEAPIRFYVTERADGSATLRYYPPSEVFAPYTSGGEKLNELAAELDGIFAAIARQATGR